MQIKSKEFCAPSSRRLFFHLFKYILLNMLKAQMSIYNVFYKF